MKLKFCLDWFKKGLPVARGFKSESSFQLFSDYLSRIQKFIPCETAGSLDDSFKSAAGTKIWVCDRGAGSKMISSEDVSRQIEKLQLSGCKEMKLVIGGPNGFSDSRMALIKPDFKWCFSPMTFPHELALIVASEQVYRAFCILKNLPYHNAH